MWCHSFLLSFCERVTECSLWSKMNKNEYCSLTRHEERQQVVIYVGNLDPAVTIHQSTRTCPVCPKTFTHAYALRGHFVRVHLRHKRYVCNVCQAGFWSNSDLERHMPRHTGQRFICDACNRTYTSKQRLTEHFRHPSACWLDPPMLKYIKAVNKVDV